MILVESQSTVSPKNKHWTISFFFSYHLLTSTKDISRNLSCFLELHFEVFFVLDCQDQGLTDKDYEELLASQLSLDNF